jgi:hypothetical protein
LITPPPLPPPISASISHFANFIHDLVSFGPGELKSWANPFASCPQASCLSQSLDYPVIYRDLKPKARKNVWDCFKTAHHEQWTPPILSFWTLGDLLWFKVSLQAGYPITQPYMHSTSWNRRNRSSSLLLISSWCHWILQSSPIIKCLVM